MSYPGLEKKLAFFKLSLFNKADNTHIPESTIENPVFVNSIKLNSFAGNLEKLKFSEPLYPELPINLQKKALKFVKKQQKIFTGLKKRLDKSKKIEEKCQLLNQLYELQTNAEWLLEKTICRINF